MEKSSKNNEQKQPGTISNDLSLYADDIDAMLEADQQEKLEKAR